MQNDKFYVVKKGVYIHGVYGPYDRNVDAMNAFHAAYVEAAENLNPDSRLSEFDGYHDYFIVEGLSSPIGENLKLGCAIKIHHDPIKPKNKE